MASAANGGLALGEAFEHVAAIASELADALENERRAVPDGLMVFGSQRAPEDLLRVIGGIMLMLILIPAVLGQWAPPRRSTDHYDAARSERWARS